VQMFIKYKDTLCPRQGKIPEKTYFCPATF
jgi:hypothetical protein